ncbi:MAG: DUF438 domain-containing protein [Candidatus Aminicenantales bacterium]
MGQKRHNQSKKEVLKDIIRKLHQGLSVDEAKKRFEEEIGEVSSTEIAEMEQSLIDEGLSPDEIKKFCNVHALLFESALEKSIVTETSASHPVYLLRSENREITQRLAKIRAFLAKRQEKNLADLKITLKEWLLDLKSIEIHYARKEQVLFPHLEKQGFFGPSKVMWGKDNEIRDLLREAIARVDRIRTQEDVEKFVKQAIEPLLEEVEGMVFKEENILFPTALEKIPPKDWVEILKASDEVGYAFITTPEETEALMKDLRHALLEEPACEDNTVRFPTGSFEPEELMAVFNTLPVDITFVDKDDRVKYYSDSADRIFLRTKSVIGRKVQHCHPPQSVDVVEKILDAFKSGRNDPFEFWFPHAGKTVYIRYYPVRDTQGQYLGTLEVSQNITRVQELEGEKRLIDERD